MAGRKYFAGWGRRRHGNAERPCPHRGLGLAEGRPGPGSPKGRDSSSGPTRHIQPAPHPIHLPRVPTRCRVLHQPAPQQADAPHERPTSPSSTSRRPAPPPTTLPHRRPTGPVTGQPPPQRANQPDITLMHPTSQLAPDVNTRRSPPQPPATHLHPTEATSIPARRTVPTQSRHCPHVPRSTGNASPVPAPCRGHLSPRHPAAPARRRQPHWRCSSPSHR